MSADATGREHTDQSGRRRWPLVVIAVIGVALVVMPFAFSMFAKTQRCRHDQPIPAIHDDPAPRRLPNDLKQIDAGVQQTNSSVAHYLNARSTGQKNFDSTYPTFASFNSEWPGIDSKMTGLMTQVQNNLGNYSRWLRSQFRLFRGSSCCPGF